MPLVAGIGVGYAMPAVTVTALITSLLVPPLLRAAVRRLPTTSAEIVRQQRQPDWSEDRSTVPRS